MREGVDRAGALSKWEARALKEMGFTFCGVYIGGPTNGGYGWSQDVVEALAGAADWEFVPIYVGRNLPWSGEASLTAANGEKDGHQAAQLMQAFGWHPNKNTPVWLDVEYDTYVYAPDKCADYMVSWANTVRAEGYFPGIYCPPQGLNHYARLAQTPTQCWGAIWLSGPGAGAGSRVAPDPKTMRGLTTEFSGYVWQYTGGTWLPGMSSDFDLNTASDDTTLAPAPSRVMDQPQQEEPMPDRVLFETGKTVQGGFLRYYTKYGGVKVFGLPLTEEIEENGMRVQYFERARFEWHQGEFPDDWDTQQGLVAKELLDARQRIAELEAQLTNNQPQG